ncbi:MAG TPA: hypothetical protein VLA76_00680 [Candidatus Angelobacter sp.]|nr:hypothetical protein [Candidatus Angelobacter sp.]
MARKRCIVWVHGIGEHRTGYSKPWRTVFNEFLKLADADYVEVLWEPVMEGRPPGARGAPAGGVRLTPEERADERRIRAELEARLAQQAVTEGGAGARYLGRPREWGAARRATPRGFWDVVTNPGESIGDFARYLASRRIRLAVKECFKLKLRPLAGESVDISVISHSWGTVVAHDALVDLAAETPDLRVANLFTLGSPLWLVRLLLEERSGRRPKSVDFWMNVHARGDLVGSWIKPGFKVDRDYEVPSVGRDAHGSYFVKGNEAVQRDLVAARILRR